MLRFLKISAKILLALVGLVLLAYLAVLAINRNDRPSSDAVHRLVRVVSELPHVRPRDNGYVYVVGFGAAKGEDPLALGTQRIAWTFKAGPGAHIYFPTKDYDREAAQTPDMKALGATCKSVGEACVAALERNNDTIAKWLAAEAWILDRYTTLLSLPGWRETSALGYDLPMPTYGLLLDAQRLHLLRAWNLAGRGDAAAVSDLLARDGDFWRRTLAGADTLIVKMIATAAVKRNFEWGNVILRRLPPAASAAAIPGHWRTPVSRAERAMMRVSAGEFMLFAASLRSLLASEMDPEMEEGFVKEAGSALITPMFQPRDSENQYAALVSSVADTLDVPIEAYPAALGRAREIVAKTVDNSFDWSLYNWPGNIVIGAGAPDFSGYGAKIADLEGVRRLALLAAELRIAKVEPGDMVKRLVEAKLRDPYADKPFGWDAGSGTVVFTGLEPVSRGRHTMLY